ncbi:hypothetical protein HMPREF1991_01330 [Hoylesella loescheii DSM 19665 = JCM 12249 = ATCC 15930]|uniref:Uncharacterized protein n=1 Tax=Hoylesella loescheii DSM 19665 = JCM 12249 = ATCC 15930 TaxID=1122985 RepID=A0A069QIG8_HOYLO|nr:hypothetical protein HMPREF1991_01330 [Hoylesella loescheii DSM 19665 = JCM 12249 = ATCC 15930]
MINHQTSVRDKKLHEFGIKLNRYINYSVALVSEITCRIFSNLAEERIASYPEFT